MLAAAKARGLPLAGRHMATFLGLDLSTQGLKATAIDSESNDIVFNDQINFDADLSHYGTEGGAIHRGGGVVNAPTLMFVEALDMVFARMAAADFDFGTVKAVSGSGQQHGSVYWREGAGATLASLAPGPLKPQLADAFSYENSPIWMDSSTSQQCAALEAALGGAEATAALTGSRAYERFTGNQIARLAATEPAAYAQTERISLISSAIPSILAGKYAPVDAADGAGTNLSDLRASPPAWAAAAVAATAPGLAEKLGDIKPSHEVVGHIATNLVATYDCAAHATASTLSASLLSRNTYSLTCSRHQRCAPPLRPLALHLVPARSPRDAPHRLGTASIPRARSSPGPAITRAPSPASGCCSPETSASRSARRTRSSASPRRSPRRRGWRATSFRHRSTPPRTW